MDHEVIRRPPHGQITLGDRHREIQDLQRVVQALALPARPRLKAEHAGEQTGIENLANPHPRPLHRVDLETHAKAPDGRLVVVAVHRGSAWSFTNREG